MSKRRNYKTPDFLDGIAKTQWKAELNNFQNVAILKRKI